MSKLRLSRLLLGFCLFGFNISQADASYLRLVPTVQIAESEQNPGGLVVSGTVENQGDEAAHDVMVESVRGGRIVMNFGLMAAGESKEFSLDMTEKDLGAERAGINQVPFRVLYKDANKVSFSSPFIVTYFKKTTEGGLGRTSPVTIRLHEDVVKQGYVDVGREGDLEVFLANTGASPLELSLELVGSKELELKSEVTNLSLNPQEEKPVKIDVKNLTGLLGSTYVSYLLVGGTVDGQYFTDYSGFVIKVTSNTSFPWVGYIFGVLALAFVSVGFYFWRKNSNDQPE